MSAHLVFLPVLVPAVLAALLLLLRERLRLQRLVSGLGVVLLLLLSLALLADSGQGPELYRLGDWPVPFGIVFVNDRLSALMLLLTAGLATVVLLYVAGTGQDIRGRHFHILFLFQLMGLNGAFLTGDLFNLFVFFEVLLIASYGLMAHGGGKARLQAAVQYVGFNLIGSTLFLFGLGVVYATVGSLNMADVAAKLPHLPEADSALLRAAGVMLLCVFAIKGALVPLQFWLPGTYANAPGAVAALFAVMTKVGAYAVIRVFGMVFAPAVPATGSLFADLLMPAALATIALGALGMLGASSLFRLAAFSAIASMGTLFAAVAVFTPEALAAALFYLVHSTLAGAILFLVADLAVIRRGSGSLAAALPAGRDWGLLGALFFVSAIAVAGMPPLSGFLGKLMVLAAIPEAARPWVWSVILGGSLVMILALARAGSLVFWKAPPPLPGAADPGPQPAAFAAVLVLAAALVALSLAAGPVHDWLVLAARGVLDPVDYLAVHGLTGGL